MLVSMERRGMARLSDEVLDTTKCFSVAGLSKDPSGFRLTSLTPISIMRRLFSGDF